MTPPPPRPAAAHRDALHEAPLDAHGHGGEGGGAGAAGPRQAQVHHRPINLHKLNVAAVRHQVGPHLARGGEVGAGGRQRDGSWRVLVHAWSGWGSCKAEQPASPRLPAPDPVATDKPRHHPPPATRLTSSNTVSTFSSVSSSVSVAAAWHTAPLLPAAGPRGTRLTRRRAAAAAAVAAGIASPGLEPRGVPPTHLYVLPLSYAACWRRAGGGSRRNGPRVGGSGWRCGRP